MSFVLDASVTAVWAFADENSALADLAAERLEEEAALVPALWWYEVRNMLVVSERRRRITMEDSHLFLDLLSSYPIETDSVEDEALVFHFARSHRLTFYDSAYLAVAKRNGVALATLDSAVRRAALAEQIPLLG